MNPDMPTTDDIEEVEYVKECPSCGEKFVGMTPQEFRQQHALEDCPNSPFPELLCFPAPGEIDQL